MCILESDRRALVCDVAIGGVRALMAADLGDAVQYTVIDGRGTLVQAAPDVDAGRFEELVKLGMAAANAREPDVPASTSSPGAPFPVTTSRWGSSTAAALRSGTRQT